MKTAVILTSSLLLLTSAATAGVKMAQTITLKPGWNAVYIEVTPDETADEIFAAWPVDSVSVYDPASYLETKQYSGTDTTEGTRASAFKKWQRGVSSPVTTLGRVVANQVYICNNTNKTDYAATLYGRPAAPRITWHPSSTNEPMNFVGLSSVPGESHVTLGGYFSGFNGGPTSYYRFKGYGQQIYISAALASDRFTDGEVLVVSARSVSDWSGVLNVSPLAGLDFSTNVNYHTLSVRNDGATNRTVSVTLVGGQGVVGSIPPPPEGLLVRDAAFPTNEWTRFPSGSLFSKDIAAGETLTLEIALDRTQFNTAAGFYYGGLLRIEDETRGDDMSRMRVTLPIEVTSDGGASSSKAWPKGTWLASGAFDSVTYLTANESATVKAGGKMKVRLPLYVEYDGQMKLLQRFIHGVDSNGVTHVYSPAVEDNFPVAIGNAKRVSSAVLPIDEPVIRTYETTNYVYHVVTNIVKVVTNTVDESGILLTNITTVAEATGSVTTNGTFGSTATFGFTVNENSKVNPYRHTFHPSHDGLRWDFETSTPSGDDYQNYVSTVKPEMFSIVNLITFKWDASTGSKWTPEEKLSGDLTWVMTGLRHEGPITMTGRFTMTRISDADLDR